MVWPLTPLSRMPTSCAAYRRVKSVTSWGCSHFSCNILLDFKDFYNPKTRTLRKEDFKLRLKHGHFSKLWGFIEEPLESPQDQYVRHTLSLYLHCPFLLLVCSFRRRGAGPLGHNSSPFSSDECKGQGKKERETIDFNHSCGWELLANGVPWALRGEEKNRRNRKGEDWGGQLEWAFLISHTSELKPRPVCNLTEKRGGQIWHKIILKETLYLVTVRKGCRRRRFHPPCRPS